jgi:predicted naringenin-chalcone synthase
MSLSILGLGTALPRHAIEQSAAMELVQEGATQTEEQRRLLPALYRRTGVQQRHSVVLEFRDEGAIPQRTAGFDSQPSHAQPSLATALSPSGLLARDHLTQSFYPPATDERDRGPSTCERMERYAREAGPLAVQAANSALDNANVFAAEITHLVTVSCTGFQAPGVDLELIRELGLSASTARSHIGFMGCHGALNGMRVARAYAESEPEGCILLVAVELCSLHHQYGWQPDRIVANALFADGAAAIVGRSSPTRSRHDRSDDSSTWKVTANGSHVLPDSEELMNWRIGDHGFEMTLSPRVPDLIRQSLKPWLCEWLHQQGRRLEDVGSWAIHPGGPRILSACGETLNLAPRLLEPSREILARYGNMSSPTVLFILKELIAAQAKRPCVGIAFGPGIAIESMLIE